jgi:ribokinase
MALDVLGIGFCCIDDLLLLTEIPPPEGRATILRREWQGGGMAATAMVAVAQLGGRAGFVPVVGDDAVGGQILDDFRRYGVDVSRAIVRLGARSHLTVVLVDGSTGARAFLSQRGDVEEVQPAELDAEYVASARIVHLSDAGPAAVQAARWARAAGREVCYDGTHFHPSIFGLAPLLDYLIVSRFFGSEFLAHQEGRDVGRFARDFAGVPSPPLAPLLPIPRMGSRLSLKGRGGDVAGEAAVHHGVGDMPQLHGKQLLAAAQRLRALGPPVVVVTEGEDGCWCASPEGDFHVPACPVQAVDTTGAGDVFHGAFLFGRAQGWDLRRALRVASAVAALKCRALGGRVGIPTLDEALALVDRGGL